MYLFLYRLFSRYCALMRNPSYLYIPACQTMARLQWNVWALQNECSRMLYQQFQRESEYTSSRTYAKYDQRLLSSPTKRTDRSINGMYMNYLFSQNLSSIIVTFSYVPRNKNNVLYKKQPISKILKILTCKLILFLLCNYSFIIVENLLKLHIKI